ncbi:SDR family oxidoreductase [Balneola sp. MJW-20]|uniref:SDR family oxidoreductase n=1 Tax=Gracilimonas aurantiaca TaxID=3234185 RepID=UPI0034666A9D
MNNKLCVITGANSGIGLETAKSLADEGAFIVMVCRNEDKASAARTQIANETGNQGIDIVLCDFSVQSEIRKAAQEILDKYDQIDVLINNHGFIASERQESVDGYEMTFAVNHLGYVLFTDLLMDAIKKSGSARIINVSSEAHRRGTFDPDDIQLKEGFSPMKAYSNSKLFNIMFTKELAKHLTDTAITANCLHPGVVATNFAQSGNFLTKTFFTLGKLFMKSPKEGAETSIYLATSPEVEGVNGAYFKDKKAATPSSEARDENAAAKLWDLSRDMCGL